MFFAYELSFRDATMRRAYQAPQETKINIKKKAKAPVKEYVDGVVNGKSPNFNETAQKINKCVADSEFRFGNIQKLLNMKLVKRNTAKPSLKYLGVK